MAAADEEFLEEIDKLNDEDKHEEVYNKLRRPDGNYKGVDLELLWRLLRAIRFLILTKGPSNKKMKSVWIQEGLDVANSSVKQYPNACLSNTWYGIMLSVKSTEEGIKERIKLGYEIRDYFDKGYAANANEYITLHCLGSWCYEVASLSRFERLFATTFFGSPPNSSFEEALEFFLAANESRPNMTFTVCRIAQCYDRLGKKAAAKEWAQKAIKLRCQDSEMETAQKECRRIAA